MTQRTNTVDVLFQLQLIKDFSQRLCGMFWPDIVSALLEISLMQRLKQDRYGAVDYRFVSVLLEHQPTRIHKCYLSGTSIFCYVSALLELSRTQQLKLNWFGAALTASVHVPTWVRSPTLLSRF